MILRIRIPLEGGREARFRKIGTRRAQAISKVVIAVAWRESSSVAIASSGAPRSPAGAAWHDVRVALGSVADRPIRAAATERALDGRPPTPETADAAAEALAAEIQPIDDVRSTAEYRRRVASNLLAALLRG